MIITVNKVKSILIYVMVFYILNKALWDFLFGGLAKAGYYGSVLICAIVGMYQLICNKSKQRYIVSAYLFYCLVVFFNGVMLSTPEQQAEGYISYITYPLVFFTMYMCYNGRFNYRKLFDRICYWGVGTSIIALYEYVAKKPILHTTSNKIYTYYDGTSSYRAVAFCGSPMYLCVLLGCAFVLAVYFFHLTKKKKYIAFMLFDLLGMFCTGSRAPLLFTLLAVAIMYLYVYKYEAVKRNTIIVIICMFVLLLFLGVILFVVPNFSTGIETIDVMISRFSSIFNFTTEWGNRERLLRWEYYINVFLDNPIFGIGVASTSAAVAGNVNVTAHGITTESGVLARLVETGIVGTFSYYYFLFLIIKNSFKQSVQLKDVEDKYFIVGILSLILLEDIVLQISLDIFCAFVMWIVLAYAFVLQNKMRSSGVKTYD